jgi:hypothetical protein
MAAIIDPENPKSLAVWENHLGREYVRSIRKYGLDDVLLGEYDSGGRPLGVEDLTELQCIDTNKFALYLLAILALSLNSINTSVFLVYLVSISLYFLSISPTFKTTFKAMFFSRFPYLTAPGSSPPCPASKTTENWELTCAINRFDKKNRKKKAFLFIFKSFLIAKKVNNNANSTFYKLLIIYFC